MNKLMGKKLGEQHDEIVSPSYMTLLSLFSLSLSLLPSSFFEERLLMLIRSQTFAKQDLPQQHRVLQPDSMKTMDHRPERLNIHVDEEGTVRDVKFG